MLVAAITFGIVLVIVFGAYWLLVAQPELREHSALSRRLKSEDLTQSRVRLLKEPGALSEIGALDSLLKRFSGFSTPLKDALDSSGLPLTVGAFLLLVTTLFLSCALLVETYTGLWWLAALGACAAAYLPFWWIKFSRTRRLRKFEEQFPEAIELISRAMRAGHAFATGIKMAADELPAPAGPEFKLLYERQNYGAQLTDALRAFADRIPLLDARFFVTAVLTQREAGGNLAEVLDRLANVMRERFKIRREVRVRSAHGRMTAYVLAAMPPTIAVFMLMTNPSQIRILTGDPLGVRMIIGAVVLQVLGTLVVRKLVDIQY
jgi:tight adherence protein B